MPAIEVEDDVPRVQYYAAGGQTVFIYPFLIFTEDELVVQNGTATLTKTTDYTVTGVLNKDGGTVVLTSGAALDDVITIYRVSSRARASQYQPDGKFNAAPLERDLDRVFTILQEDKRDISRTIRLSPEDQLTDFTLPTDRANKFLAFSATGVPIASTGPTSSGTPFGDTGVDLAATTTPAEARTVIGLASNAALKSVYSLGSLVDLSEVSNTVLSDMAANTVKVRAASTSGDPSDLALSTSQFLGRGSSGDIAPCSFGAGLLMSGTTLNVTSGSTLMTPTTVSGTSVPFTSIPSGVKRITVGFEGLSTNGGNYYILQIGPSGGVETTGYVSQASGGSATNGFILNSSNSANVHYGAWVLTIIDPSTNTWVCHGAAGTGVASFAMTGSKSLAGVLSQLRVTTNGGTDTFDGSGKINVLYEV